MFKPAAKHRLAFPPEWTLCGFCAACLAYSLHAPQSCLASVFRRLDGWGDARASLIGLNVKTFQNKHHIETVHTILSAVLGSGIRISGAALWKENTSAQNGRIEHIFGDDLFCGRQCDLTP